MSPINSNLAFGGKDVALQLPNQLKVGVLLANAQGGLDSHFIRSSATIRDGGSWAIDILDVGQLILPHAQSDRAFTINNVPVKEWRWLAK